jgi:hypothetical protein
MHDGITIERDPARHSGSNGEINLIGARLLCGLFTRADVQLKLQARVQLL